MTPKEIEILKQILKRSEYVTLKTFGNSMFPTIKKHDKIVIKAGEQISKDDIVVFLSKKEDEYVIVAHRVIDIIAGKFAITKGDNNANFDHPIRIKNIFAKVVGIIAFEET